jgi:hypothetical protein
MRVAILRWLLVSPLAMAGPLPAVAGGAPAPSLTVTLHAPERIVEGDRTAVVAEVRLKPTNDLPMMLTPSSEGTAIEVVRGRLLRAESEDPAAEALKFRIPVVARGTGTAVLRVRVLAYACDGRCREVRAERSLTLRVHPR